MTTTTTFHRLAQATSRDSAVIADLVRLWREAREDRLRFLTDLHGPDEDAAYLSGMVLPENEVWVAQVGSALAGFIGFARGWVDHLYVAPALPGPGRRHVAIAMRSNPALQL